ncbi:hypothetical protein F2Q69_00045171 [Brassica cretica]|uniref:Uncharacterized protein n=1 Tax=Brassica cretica TaxID=69181 RepID=A0A8S9NJI9_BRACR|nr:hypothetical protein F2Q69_00045171 [Brassica cretica]
MEKKIHKVSSLSRLFSRLPLRNPTPFSSPRLLRRPPRPPLRSSEAQFQCFRSRAPIVDLGGSRCCVRCLRTALTSSHLSPLSMAVSVRVSFSIGGLWWVAWSLLRMGLDSPRGGLQWRRLVVSFGSPLRNLCSGGVALLAPVFPPCASCSCSGGVYPSGLSVLYGLWVKRVYTVTEGGFVGSNLQVFLSYDGIIRWCRNLVSPVVVRV